MLSTLLKKLRIATDGAELKSWKIDEKLNLETCFNYTFFGEDSLMQGSVVLLSESKIYSNLSCEGVKFVSLKGLSYILNFLDAC